MNNFVFDLGGTNIKAGFFSAGELVEEFQFDAQTHAPMTSTLLRIESALNEVAQRNKVTHVTGVGFSYAGLADSINNRVLGSNDKYPDSASIDYSEWARQKFGCRFVIENDARAACLGEYSYGAGRGCDDLVVMTLGTGIGTAAVIRGRLLCGKHLQAGVLGGHFVIDQQATLCNCGNRGCAESLASTWALPHLIKNILGERDPQLIKVQRDYWNLSFKNLFALAAEGNRAALRVRDACLEVWANTALNLVHAYDPEKIIMLGGIVQGQAELICQSLQERIDNFAWLAQPNQVTVCAGKYINSAALWGMQYLLSKENATAILL